MTATPENPLVQFKDQLDRATPAFKAALPAHITPERFTRVVLTAVQLNPKLLDLERKSFITACIQAATDGLLPDGREGAITPHRDKKRGITVAVWQPMIAGLRKKARNSGEILTWTGHVVRERDEFDFALGDEEFIRHRPTLAEDPGEVIAAYSIATLRSGEKTREVMSIREVHKIRDRSEAWKQFQRGDIYDTPWNTWPEQMAIKTVCKRHAKALPMSVEVEEILRREDPSEWPEAEVRTVGRPRTRAAIAPPREPGDIGDFTTHASEHFPAGDDPGGSEESAEDADPASEGSSAEPRGGGGSEPPDPGGGAYGGAGSVTYMAAGDAPAAAGHEPAPMPDDSKPTRRRRAGAAETAADDTEHRKDVLAAAGKAADKGSAAFSAWYSRQPKADIPIIDEVLNVMHETAREADQQFGKS